MIAVGRHAVGGPLVASVPRGSFDADRRERAAQVGARFGGWWVLWGVYSRRFWAFAWFTTRPVIVTGIDAGELMARMRDVHAAVTAKGPTDGREGGVRDEDVDAP